MPGRSSLLRQMTVLTMLLASVGIGVQFALAEQPQTEELSLPLGSVFEILVQEGAPGTQYAWVLSLDRTFLQAGRGRVLRTRFSQPGKYLLSAEVVPARLAGEPAGGKSIRRSFVISVKEDLAPEPAPTSVATVPPHVSGMIGLSETQRLVKIIPPQGILSALAVDADVNVDEDGDGTADNDRSSADTFLGTDALPLFLWITGEPPKTFSLTGQIADGSTFTQQFTVRIGDAQTPVSGEEPPPQTGGIEYTEQENGSVHLRMQEDPPPNTPVLPLWDFGDGTQSMHLAPVHSYGSSGTYVVRVRLKDLRNGIDIRDLRQSILVRGSADAAPTDPETPPEKEPKPEPGRTSRIMGLVIKILLFLIVAAAIGGAATFAFLKLRQGKSLADRLEEADKKMAIGKEGTGTEIAPMSLPEIVDEAPKKPAPPPAPTPAKETAAPAPSPTPVLSDTSIPDWLNPTPKKAEPAPAPAPAPKPVAPAPAPAPAPKPAPAAPAPAPTPPAAPAAKEAPKPQAPVSGPDGPLPAWLQPKENGSPPATAVPAPAPAPTPAAAPVPPPASQPVVVATPAPAVSAPIATKPVPAPVAPPKPAPAPMTPPSVPAPALLPDRQAPKPTPAPVTAPVVPQVPKPAPAPEVPAPKPVASVPTEKIPDNPPSPAPVKDPTPTAHIAPKTPSAASTSNQQPATSPAEGKILTDKERERRRLKRQRYRQNKAKREAEASQTSPSTQPPAANENPQRPDDAPVAFIRAESIEKQPQPNQPTKPNPPPQESK